MCGRMEEDDTPLPLTFYWYALGFSLYDTACYVSPSQLHYPLPACIPPSALPLAPSLPPYLPTPVPCPCPLFLYLLSHAVVIACPTFRLKFPGRSAYPAPVPAATPPLYPKTDLPLLPSPPPCLQACAFPGLPTAHAPCFVPTACLPPLLGLPRVACTFTRSRLQIGWVFI